MPFPPPTDGFVEQPLGDTLMEYLAPSPSTTMGYELDRPFDMLHLEKGDVVVVEAGRNPHQGCYAIVELDGDVFMCRLHWHKGQWFAETDERRGKVPEDMRIQGIVRHSIKNQIKD